MPQGVWQVVFIASPQCSPSCILISFERISTSASSHDPHQLVSFVANKANLMYMLDFIHAHYNRSVVDCFSLVTHVHFISSNLDIQTFKHLSWPIVSINSTLQCFTLCYSIMSHATIIPIITHPCCQYGTA